MRIILLVALITISISSNSMADWIRLTSDTYFDADTVEIHKPSIISYWSKTKLTPEIYNQFTQSKKYKYNKYSHTLTRREVNCSNSTLRFIQSINYSKSGSVIASLDNNYTTFDHVVPDSVGEGELKALCSIFYEEVNNNYYSPPAK